MGKEEEVGARAAVFGAWSVTAELFAEAEPDAIVLHCLPAYRGKEIAAEVLDGPRSVVWDEAENRRHAQKAILAWLLEEMPASRDELTSLRPATKNARHQQIVELVTHHEVRSQAELADLLAVDGVRVTQATLSRDLRRARRHQGARSSGALVYAVPAEGGDRRPAAPGESAAGHSRLARLCARAAGQRRGQRQPRRAAHPARRRPVPRLRLRQGRAARACSAPSPATTPSW